jgi:hypothetical protein
MCLADDGLLVLHRVYGVPAGQCPVLQLHRSGEAAMFTTYLVAFERLWAGARPA